MNKVEKIGALESRHERFERVIEAFFASGNFLLDETKSCFARSLPPAGDPFIARW